MYNGKLMYECKTEEERQALRDKYMEVTYHQTILQNGTLDKILERLKQIEEKIDIMSKTQVEEHVESISSTDILALFNKE